MLQMEEEETLKMDESRAEKLRNASRKRKALAMEKFREGNLAGAKARLYVATYMCPELPGIRRFNAILDVTIGYTKKINGSVDWYAVLGAYPTEDVATIRKRYRKLLLDMTMDHDDSLVGSTYKAIKILSDAWKFLCNEKGKKLYDKRRRYQLRLNYRRHKSSRESAPVLLVPVRSFMSNEVRLELQPLQLGVPGDVRKRKEPPSKDIVSHVKQRRNVVRHENPVVSPESAPQVILEELKAFTKEDRENSKEPVIKTPKGKAVVASDDEGSWNGK